MTFASLLLNEAARSSELVLTPSVTFAEVAARWLAEFEARVAAGSRRERTLEEAARFRGRQRKVAGS